MRCALAILLALVGCKGDDHKPAKPVAEPWVHETAAALADPQYAAAVDGIQDPMRYTQRGAAPTIEAKGTCGDAALVATFWPETGTVSLSIKRPGYQLFPVALRVGGKVAFEDKAKWEDVNQLSSTGPIDARLYGDAVTKRWPERFVPGQHADVELEATVAVAKVSGIDFTWEKRRTLKGVRFRFPVPDPQAFAAHVAMGRRLGAEEQVLEYNDPSSLKSRALRADETGTAEGRAVAEAYARRREELDRKWRELEADPLRALGKQATLDTTGCKP